MSFHVDTAHVYLPDAGVVTLKTIRANRKEPYREFKSVDLCIEGLWIVHVHILEHCVDDEVWLVVLDHPQQLQAGKDAHKQHQNDREEGSHVGLIRVMALKVHIHRLAKEIEASKEATEATPPMI